MTVKQFPDEIVEKVTPVNNDWLPIADSADSDRVKKIRYSNVKGEKWDSFVFRWAYAWGTSYVVNDVVTYTDWLSYVCILASTWNLPTNTTYWQAIITPVNASTSTQWVAEEATLSEQGSQTATGGSGARLFINPVNTAKTSSGSWDENKIPLLNSAGKLESWFIDASAFNEALFGNGSDWAQPDSNLTITWSNNTFITKNFSSWTAGSTSRTCTVTPTNCVVRIKISGNADFTNRTFNFAWVGWPWGAQQTGGTGNTWAIWNTSNYLINNPWLWWTLGAVSAAGWAAWAKLSSSLNTNLFYIDAFCGAGGWSGWSNAQSWTNGWAGWAGGNWWGWLIITVWGTVVFSSTTATVAWANGTAWTNGTWGASGGWGGWWGGWWTFVMLYRWTLTWSLTPTVTGWTWAAGWTGWGSTAGAWWGGAGSLFNAWTAGASTSSSSTWWTGGNWWNGTYLIQKI